MDNCRFYGQVDGFVNTVYGPPHECKGTLRTRGAVCVYVLGLQMEVILLATMSSARACSNYPIGREDHSATSEFMEFQRRLVDMTRDYGFTMVKNVIGKRACGSC